MRLFSFSAALAEYSFRPNIRPNTRPKTFSVDHYCWVNIQADQQPTLCAWFPISSYFVCCHTFFSVYSQGTFFLNNSCTRPFGTSCRLGFLAIYLLPSFLPSFRSFGYFLVADSFYDLHLISSGADCRHIP
jgi:hypothetical protein